MSNEFMEKIKSISEFKKLSDNEEQFAFTATFNKEKDGLVKITADKGEFIYQLKPFEELYAEQESRNNTKEELMSLLYQIERTIKEYDTENYCLTDSSVILALEQLSIRNLTNNLRMFMSMHNFSRNELRQGINRVLRSARRHNKVDGTRGYLDFIIEHVP
jgi:hypothetical protein